VTRLDGRTALVTGAGQGIGAAIAARLAGLGARVAVNSLHPSDARSVAERLRSTGADAIAVPADVASCEQVDEMVTRVEHAWGSVDIVVNNAATLSMAPFLETTPSSWHEMIAVNLGGTVACTRRVLGGMLAAGWGRIVNMASIWGTIGARGATAYCASKAGQIGFTSALGQEVMGRGVVVTALAPGVVDTPQLEADAAFAGMSLTDMKKIYAKGTLVGRIGTAEEIAATVAFLVSEHAAVFNGQTLLATGGRAD
jgi:NAD(P)-dependent dehydrogenase (short-subunit alcohol dehydrogenase family)